MKMSHVGIMVGEMDRAVEFYTKALGLEVVMGKSAVVEEQETAIGKMCIAVFGSGFGGFNIAHLVTKDGIGMELFEMKDREEKHRVDFKRIGIFHFCLETDDFKGVVHRVEQYGGKVRSDFGVAARMASRSSAKPMSSISSASSSTSWTHGSVGVPTISIWRKRRSEGQNSS